MASSLRLRDPDALVRELEMFVFEHVGRGRGALVGLSGGLDSAVVLALAARALGPDRVLGLLLPDGTHTPEGDMEDARAWARQLGIEAQTLSLRTPLRDLGALVPAEVEGDPRHRGNLKARLRMTLLYALANAQDRLVLGTGNRSEWLLGYFTKHGDGAADLQPLGALYKTQVRQLAASLNVPLRILDKPPSAGLWEGQTDERELGAPYDTIDRVLHEGVDRGRPPSEIAQNLNLPEQRVRNLLNRVEANAHKRAPAPRPEVR